ncbi:hypothetical protein Tco_0467933, partial [Tanacetum coccineum]
RLIRLEKKVEAMSKIDHTEAIEESVQANVMNEEKKKRRRKDTEPSKKNIDQVGSSKKGKTPSKPSKSDKPTNTKESVQDAAMDDEELVQDDAMDADNMTQADTIHKQDNSKWFKQDVVVRPKTLDPDWFKEPNANDAPKQNWFNELVNVEKDPFTFDDLMSSTVDFNKYAKHYQIDWANSEDHEVYSRMKILSVIRISVDKQFGYGYLKEIVVRRVDQKEYTFNEADFTRLHLNDIEDMYLLYAQNKLHHLKGNEQVDLVTALRLFI